MNGAIGIAMIFCPLAASAAFVISYQENSRHYPDRKTRILLSLGTAAVAFAVFFAITLTAAWLIPGIVQSQGNRP